MFNVKQKEEYLKENEGRNVALRLTMNAIFATTEARETELNKDAAEWTVAEILSFYKTTSTASFFGLNNRHSQLKQYAQWCLDHNMLEDGQNHYLEIDAKAIHDCLNIGLQTNGILTRKEMEMEIQKLLNPREQCLVYALFEGIQGREFCELTELNMRQVDGNSLHLATRTIKVNLKLIELMEEATETYDYLTYGKEQKNRSFDSSDDNVFKRIYNAKKETQIRKRQRLYTTLTRIKDYLDNPAINTTSLMESGRIDMVSGLMDKNGTDLETTLRLYADEITNKYGKITSIPNYLLNYGRFYGEK